MSGAGAAGSERRDAGFWLAVAAAVLILPVLLTGRGGTSEASDEIKYHLPIIETMRAQWPAVDIVGYDSATAPGYHITLAAIAEITGLDVLGLRIINALIAIVLLVVLHHVARRWTTAGVAAILLLPVLLSTYFLSGAIWLTTDNAGLLWVMIALGAITASSTTAGGFLGAGLAATIAVATRQVHLWVAGPIALAGIVAAPIVGLPKWLRTTESPRWSWLVAAGIAAAMPALLLWWLFRQWGGLTPPAYRDLHDVGVNTATYAFALALFGGFGVFFAPALGWRRLAAAARDWIMWAAGAAGFGLALIWPTSYDFPWRSGGALWSLVEGFPAIAERSVLLPPLAAVGAMLLVVLVRGAIARDRGRTALVLVVAFAAFVLAQSFNSRCFQRYLEVLVLAMLAWLTAMAMHPPGPVMQRSRWWIGLLVLGGGQLLITVLNMYLPVLRAGG